MGTDWTPVTDQALNDLTSQESITAARREAETKYQDFTSDQIRYLRRRAKNDLYFLMTGLLEYDLMSERLHGHVAKWYQKTRDSRYRMTLLPRDHYKSTICTISDSIQMGLPNIDDVVQSHPHHLGPNVKILLSHEVREKAASFLFEITAAFTRKPAMLALFPECIPSRSLQRINKWELELPRDQHHKEATFSTIGAGGAAQGGHYHWLKLDDLVGEDARDSETVMGRVLTWFDNINSLLTRPKMDGWDLIGTRWAFNDVYSHAMERYHIDVEDSVLGCIPDKEVEKYKDGILKVYARGMIENGNLIFPEENDWEYVNVLRKNPIVWAAQYANNPLESGLNEFQWPLKFYNIALRDPQKLVVFSGDTSFTRYFSDLDICIFVDPSMAERATSDHVGIVVTGVDHKGNIFLLETVKARINPARFMDELYRLNFKYRPRVVAIEEVVFSAIFRYWIEDRERLTGVHLPIRAFKPGTKRSKNARIRGLTHFFSAGQVYVQENMHDFRDEYEQFPMSKSEHLLDALAQGPEFWQRGNGYNDVRHNQKALEQMMSERDALTGY